MFETCGLMGSGYFWGTCHGVNRSCFLPSPPFRSRPPSHRQPVPRRCIKTTSPWIQDAPPFQLVPIPARRATSCAAHACRHAGTWPVHAALPYPQVPAVALHPSRAATPHVQLRASRHDAEAPRARPSPRNAPVRCKSCIANEREAEREGLPVIALPARRGCSPPPRPCEYRPTTRCGIRELPLSSAPCWLASTYASIQRNICRRQDGTHWFGPSTYPIGALVLSIQMIDLIEGAWRLPSITSSSWIISLINGNILFSLWRRWILIMIYSGVGWDDEAKHCVAMEEYQTEFLQVLHLGYTAKRVAAGRAKREKENQPPADVNTKDEDDADADVDEAPPRKVIKSKSKSKTKAAVTSLGKNSSSEGAKESTADATGTHLEPMEVSSNDDLVILPPKASYGKLSRKRHTPPTLLPFPSISPPRRLGSLHRLSSPVPQPLFLGTLDVSDEDTQPAAFYPARPSLRTTFCSGDIHTSFLRLIHPVLLAPVVGHCNGPPVSTPVPPHRRPVPPHQRPVPPQPRAHSRERARVFDAHVDALRRRRPPSSRTRS
ncbi:hypothetical protein GGX14DRAFT_560725 [Mycena pura]|uniref:Uncharacterized protein n=1 Tax=Mycena pura TaxID=153505 RepID=A0AAD6VRS1_9AGAR|nr:hypothetical protein GGX14DRAFT_560725 [Mycena pura]